MDMSDLDFSSPVNKTEKTTEKSSKELLLGKQESKKDKFSFSFDFNEYVCCTPVMLKVIIFMCLNFFYKLLL